MASLMPQGKQRYTDNNGNNLSGGKLFAYSAGTSTPLDTYSDQAGSVPNTNPVILNARGEATIFWGSAAYKVVLKDASDVEIWTQDNLQAAVSFADLSSTASGKGAALVGFMPTGTGAVATTVQAALDIFKQYSSGQFFVQDGARVNRLHDRLLVAGAAVNDAAFPNVTQDWLTVFQVAAGLTSGSVVSSQSAVLNHHASAGVAWLSGAQSLNFASAGSSCIASSAYSVNNNATLATNAWTFYGEAHRTTASAGSIYGMELDTRTLTNSIAPTPFQQGDVIGAQIASGAELTGKAITASISDGAGGAGTVLNVTAITASSAVYNIQVGSKIYGVGVTAGTEVTALGTGTGGVGTYTVNNSQLILSERMVATNQYHASAAIQIASNPVAFKVGISLSSTAIDGTDGVTGQGVAVALAKGHQLNWYNSAGNSVGRVVSTAATVGHVLNFTDSGAQFAGINNPGAVAYFTSNASAANWLLFGNSATGVAPYVASGGGDTDVDLALTTQGAGVLRFGTHTTAAVAQSGYITIKDAGGATRRLLVG